MKLNVIKDEDTNKFVNKISLSMYRWIRIHIFIQLAKCIMLIIILIQNYNQCISYKGDL